MQILVVEDDPKTAQALATGLAKEGYGVCVATSGEEGFYRLNSAEFAVVILDWMLPGRSGVEVMRTLREKGFKTPILLLTARDAVEDRVLGLEAGADDYLVKPFAFPELLARVRSLLRRATSESEPMRRILADLVVDLESRRAWRGGRQLELTPREFDLLGYLLRHRGQTVSREMLARDVWRTTNRLTSLDNVIDVHMAHLRRKVDADPGEKLIQTVRSLGFVIREPRQP